MRSISIKSISILIAFSIMATPLSLNAQQNTTNATFTDGMMAGEMAASGNAGWLLGGFLCGIFGVGGAFLIEPSPPVHFLIGKNSEYIMGFTQSYKSASKKKNLTYASIGCLGSLAFNIMMSGG